MPRRSPGYDAEIPKDWGPRQSAGDLWNVEIYYADAMRPAHRYTGVGGDRVQELMSEALRMPGVGGVVAYRPPDYNYVDTQRGADDAARPQG